MTPVAPKTQITAPELEALMDELKMPHAKLIAADLLATAKAQRWEPAEAVRALLSEEATGRAAALLASRRKAAKFPTGKTFDTWDPQASSIDLPRQQSLRTLEWIERKENLVLAGPSGTGKRSSSKPSVIPRSSKAKKSPGSASRNSARSSALTNRTSPSLERSTGS